MCFSMVSDGTDAFVWLAAIHEQKRTFIFLLFNLIFGRLNPTRAAHQSKRFCSTMRVAIRWKRIKWSSAKIPLITGEQIRQYIALYGRSHIYCFCFLLLIHRMIIIIYYHFPCTYLTNYCIHIATSNIPESHTIRESFDSLIPKIPCDQWVFMCVCRIPHADTIYDCHLYRDGYSPTPFDAAL